MKSTQKAINKDLQKRSDETIVTEDGKRLSNDFMIRNISEMIRCFLAETGLRRSHIKY